MKKGTHYLPYKIDVAMMINRLEFHPENDKIKRIRQLFILKENGIVAVSDIVHIIQACRIHEIYWKLHTREIKTEDAIFSYGKLLALCEKCGVMKIDSAQRDLVNEQLERIYKKQ